MTESADHARVLDAETVAGLDSGIRDLVVWLNSLGIPTSDSGDGASKPSEERTIDVPHVCATYEPGDTALARLHAFRLARELPDREGASIEVQASWNPRTNHEGIAVLFLVGYTNADVPV